MDFKKDQNKKITGILKNSLRGEKGFSRNMQKETKR